jgi:hypothetical protein
MRLRRRTRIKGLKSVFAIEFRLESLKIGVIFGDRVTNPLAIYSQKLTQSDYRELLLECQAYRYVDQDSLL